MSLMASLNFVQSSPKNLRVHGIVAMRQKLIDRISDQIALIQASESGQAYLDCKPAIKPGVLARDGMSALKSTEIEVRMWNMDMVHQQFCLLF